MYVFFRQTHGRTRRLPRQSPGRGFQTSIAPVVVKSQYCSCHKSNTVVVKSQSLLQLSNVDSAPSSARTTTQLENNYFTEMCSGSEAGSYFRLIDFVYHSTLGLRAIKKKKNNNNNDPPPPAVWCGGTGQHVTSPSTTNRLRALHNLGNRLRALGGAGRTATQSITPCAATSPQSRIKSPFSDL